MNNVIPDAKVRIQEQALTCDIEDLENRFDDLRNTKALVEEYLKDEDENKDDEGVEEFCSMVNKLQHKFKEAIKTMDSEDGPGKIKECMDAYVEALGGLYLEEKFTREWKKILKKKVSKMINNNTNDDY